MSISITNLINGTSLATVVNVGQEITQGSLDALYASNNPSTANPVITLSALTSQLSNKADSSHTHTIANVTNLQASLDAKASLLHTHAIADVTNLQATLDGKAALSHLHVISDVTGLQAALDGKALYSHSHFISDVTGLQATLDAKAPLSSPALTGVPTTPTASVGTNTTQIASTEFVTSAIAAIPGGGGGVGLGDNTFTGNQIITVNNSLPALRITQTGAGNVILIEDSANPDATPFYVSNSGAVVTSSSITCAKIISTASGTGDVFGYGLNTITAQSGNLSTVLRINNDSTANSLLIRYINSDVLKVDYLGNVTFGASVRFNAEPPISSITHQTTSLATNVNRTDFPNEIQIVINGVTHRIPSRTI